jgi:transposase
VIDKVAAHLSGLNVEACLRLVLEHLPDQPINRVNELLPWNVVDQIKPAQLAAA